MERKAPKENPVPAGVKAGEPVVEIEGRVFYSPLYSEVAKYMSESQKEALKKNEEIARLLVKDIEQSRKTWKVTDGMINHNAIELYVQAEKFSSSDIWPLRRIARKHGTSMGYIVRPWDAKTVSIILSFKVR
jgi:hypothetical protein